MPAEKTLALVLRVIDFSETSCVVTLFTEDFGKITALAKGARRPKGPFESALDLLALVRIVFLRKSSEALDLLTEAKLERRFRAAASDLARLYAGYYVAELLRELTDTGDPHPELFQAANAALLALDDEGDVAAHVLRFELAALRILGHLPALEECVECGRPVAATGRVAFGLLAGGVLCSHCRTGKKQVLSVSGAVLATLREFAAPSTAEPRELPRPQRGELRGIVNSYLAAHLGRRPKLHEYLGTLVH